MSNLHSAPLSDGHTGSSYPHWFTNGYDKKGDGSLKSGVKGPLITFGNSDCDKAPSHSSHGSGSSDHYLLEFPVFTDGHEYKYDSKKAQGRPPRLAPFTPTLARCFVGLWLILMETRVILSYVQNSLINGVECVYCG